jgi:hypothetical protein
MINNLLWEAWVDRDEHACNNIYVMGETGVRGCKVKLVKKYLPGIPKENLLLEIKAVKASGGKKRAEMIYSEPLISAIQYTSVTIFYKNRVLAEIKEIEQLEFWFD